MRAGRLIGAGLLAGAVLAAMPVEPRPRSYAVWGAPYVMPFDTVEGSPKGAEATRVGWQPGQVTPTPCPWWGESAMRQPWEPVPWCMNVGWEETLVARDATATAGVADGSIYDWSAAASAPDWTPTVRLIGTWPVEALASVAPTLTALALRDWSHPEREQWRVPEGSAYPGWAVGIYVLALWLLALVLVSSAVQLVQTVRGRRSIDTAARADRSRGQGTGY